MARSTHPQKLTGCADCGAGTSTWVEKRTLPQIGQTFECSECGREVYAYDAGDQGEQALQWRPVTDGMATNLLFFGVVGEWPDQALTELFREGLERAEAIDYHIVEIEGLTQTEWADKRDVAQGSVSENISKAKEKLDDE